MMKNGKPQKANFRIGGGLGNRLLKQFQAGLYLLKFCHWIPRITTFERMAGGPVSFSQCIALRGQEGK